MSKKNLIGPDQQRSCDRAKILLRESHAINAAKHRFAARAAQRMTDGALPLIVSLPALRNYARIVRPGIWNPNAAHAQNFLRRGAGPFTNGGTHAE